MIYGIWDVHLTLAAKYKISLKWHLTIFITIMYNNVYAQFSY